MGEVIVWCISLCVSISLSSFFAGVSSVERCRADLYLTNENWPFFILRFEEKNLGLLKLRNENFFKLRSEKMAFQTLSN